MSKRWMVAAVLAISGMVGFGPRGDALAQATTGEQPAAADDADVVVEPRLYSALEYRMVGPYRGGRSTAVTGVIGERDTFYFGGTGGGVWKTEDAGETWHNVSDGFFEVGSIGAVRVAPSDPNVVYVGTGSACPRGNVSPGRGVYRSTDGGETWTFVGLPEAGQIGRVVVHPEDPDLVYVAALGHIFGPNEERGVFRSRDGGDTWEKLAGGLPAGVVGKVGVSASPAEPGRVWAIVEAEGDAGGVYRSDDGGDSWRRLNGDRELRQRPWYYTHVHADPHDADTVWVLNTSVYRSVDGGRTFEVVSAPHGDHHDLWLHPDDPDVMINGNDGGANVSLTDGRTWSTQRNQPTAELYRVTVDDRFPYRLYGSQQDNSSISVPSAITGGIVSTTELEFQVGGCESGHIAIDPREPDIVYAGCFGGSITRTDLRTGQQREIISYPQMQLGMAPRDLEFRYQWNAPIRLSPHDPDVLYHTSNVVHRSTDGGQSWVVISPDLTTDDPETQDYAGGPITHDSTGVEVYNTVFAFEESPHTPGLLWAGSDDGLVHISRDGGDTWTDITPEDMPEGGTVNVIELSAHGPGRAFLAVYNYRMDDFRPYVFRTNDYGDSWELLTGGDNGIPEPHFVRVVREDPNRRGLLYAGTEFGIYVSFDDGVHWQRFQNNLPVTPVTDMQVHRGDLVVATQGRSFWILDDLTPLHQLTDAARSRLAADGAVLFAPRPAYRMNMGTWIVDRSRLAQNPPNGALIHFALDDEPAGEVKLEILDASGQLVRSYSSEDEADRDVDPFAAALGFGGLPTTVPKTAGLNRFVWDLRHEPPKLPEGAVVWGFAQGAPAVPGRYRVRLSVGEWSQTRDLEVRLDPRLDVPREDLEEQLAFLGEIEERLAEVTRSVETIRSVRAQLDDLADRLGGEGETGTDTAAGSGTQTGAGAAGQPTPAELVAEARTLAGDLAAIEAEFLQTRNESSQDPLNFPPKLLSQILYLHGVVAGGFGGTVEARPTDGSYRRLEDLDALLEDVVGRYRELVDERVPAFNERVREAGVAPIIVR